MQTLLVVLIVAALVAGLVVWLRSRNRAAAATAAGDPAPARAADPLRRELTVDPRELKVGDLVGYAGQDYLVRGSVTLHQEGDTWWEHHLDAGEGERVWLSVEDGEDGLETVLWRGLAAPELQPEPRLSHGGVTYVRTESGQADYTAAGATGTPASGRTEYHDYAATSDDGGDGGRRLSFERFGVDSYEIGVGEVVSPESLDIYPVTPGGVADA